MYRKSLSRVVTVIALAILLQGCEASPSVAEWTVTTDTLPTGTIHTVNTPPESDPGPTWVLDEELRIGTVDGDGPTSFGQLKGIAITAEGHIVVLDALAQELRVFDAEGRHLTTYGGKGGGPGELESAYGLMMSPDGMLWVPDHGNARMSLYDPSSGFTSSFPLHILMYGFVWRGVLDNSGRILKPSITLGPPRRNVLRVYDPEMTLADTLPLPDPPTVDRENPPGAFYWEAPDGRSSGYVGVPFYARGHQLIDPRGVVWSTEPGNPSYRVIRWVPGGDTTLVLETRRAPIAIPAVVRDSAVEEVREQLRQRGSTSQDWSKIPEVRPAVESVFVAEDGDLWVRVASPDTMTRYDVYDWDGRYSGTVATSLSVYRWLQPIVRGDLFWALVTDELDVQFVVQARIRPVGLD